MARGAHASHMPRKIAASLGGKQGHQVGAQHCVPPAMVWLVVPDKV